MISFLILIVLVFLINKILTSSAQPSSAATTTKSTTTSGNTFTNTSNKMVTVINSKEEFATATSAQNLVVVDFFATWCGPCKMIAPMLEKFSKEYESAAFYKVDVDELPEVASAQDITSMPTILFFKAGELVGKVIGANPAAIKQALTKYA